MRTSCNNDNNNNDDNNQSFCLYYRITSTLINCREDLLSERDLNCSI